MDAKNSTAVTTIPRAQATGRLQVVTRAHVTTIAVGDDGRVAGVNYVTDGVEYFQPAKVVLLASYTYENSRLLLLSASRAFPKGLSNNHGQVGRHYFSHHTGALGHARCSRGTPTRGTACRRRASRSTTGPTTTSITAAWTSSAAATCGSMSDRRPIGAAGMSTFGRAPRWGSQWKAFISENADRTNTAYLQKTTLPYEDNYLDLDPVVKDPLGAPVCRITAEYKENERRIAAFTQDKMEQWYRAAGAIAIERGPVGGAMGLSTHAYGGTRMGDNAETNVVDRLGFSHEAPNLAVLGASVMGTSGAHNPTLTVQALAWRTADHLLKNWKTIAAAKPDDARRRRFAADRAVRLTTSAPFRTRCGRRPEDRGATAGRNGSGAWPLVPGRLRM